MPYQDTNDKLTLPCDSYGSLDIFGQDNMLRSSEIDEDMILSNLVQSPPESPDKNPPEQVLAKEVVAEDQYLIDNKNQPTSPLHIWEPTLPNEFSLRIAEGHGPSIFSNEPLTIGTELGPLAGTIIREMDVPDDSDLHDIWEIGTENNPMYLSTRAAEDSDWLRHIRPAPSQSTANCLSAVVDGRLFFRVVREILAGDELLYWTVDNDSKWSKKRLDKTSKKLLTKE